MVTSGNVHDSAAFDLLYEKVTGQFPEIKTVAMDAEYKTPWICKRIIDDGRIPSLPYKRPMTKKGFHEWYKYVYDEYLDIVICPEYKSLLYSTTNRKSYREYKSLRYQCEACQTRHLCTEQELSEDSTPPYLGGLHRAGGGYPALTAGKRKLPTQFPDNRESFYRRKRKIWNALYAIPGPEKSPYVGKAEICCHEP